MAWARLDDGWHDHPKVIAAGLEAAGLWVMCLTWAHANRRSAPIPGFIPRGVVVRFAAGRATRLAAKLVAVGLLEASDGGWLVHDFAEYLPHYDPAARAEAGRAGAAKRWGRGRPPPPPSDGRPHGEPMADRHAAEDAGIGHEQVTAAESLPARDHLANVNDQRHTPAEQPEQIQKMANRYAENGSRASARTSPSPSPYLPSGDDPTDTRVLDARDDAHSTAGTITALYAAGVPLTDHARALRTIGVALDAGIAPDLIRRGIGRLIAEQRACTPDTLRIAIYADDQPAGQRPGRRRTATEKAEGWLTVGLDDTGDTPNLRALPGGAS